MDLSRRQIFFWTPSGDGAQFTALSPLADLGYEYSIISFLRSLSHIVFQ